MNAIDASNGRRRSFPIYHPQRYNRATHYNLYVCLSGRTEVYGKKKKKNRKNDNKREREKEKRDNLRMKGKPKREIRSGCI